MDRANDDARKSNSPSRQRTYAELADYYADRVRREGATFADFSRLVEIASYLRDHQYDEGMSHAPLLKTMHYPHARNQADQASGGGRLGIPMHQPHAQTTRPAQSETDHHPTSSRSDDG